MEELQSDPAETKQMFREQVDLLVKQLNEKGVTPLNATVPV